MLLRFILLAPLALLAACTTTPGLYEQLPAARVATLHKVLVLSVVGDRVRYQPGNVMASEQIQPNESAELSLAGLSLDDLVETRTRELLETRLKLSTISPPPESRKALFELYTGKASPYDDGLAFKRIRPTLQALATSSGADTIVMILKGVQPLPGDAGNWVQGATISGSANESCALYPNAMIAILDAHSLAPLAVNHIRLWESDHNTSRASVRATASLCRKHLEDLTPEQHDYVLTALAWSFRPETLEASFARLLPPVAP